MKRCKLCVYELTEYQKKPLISWSLDSQKNDSLCVQRQICTHGLKLRREHFCSYPGITAWSSKHLHLLHKWISTLFNGQLGSKCTTFLSLKAYYVSNISDCSKHTALVTLAQHNNEFSWAEWKSQVRFLLGDSDFFLIANSRQMINIFKWPQLIYILFLTLVVVLWEV